MKLTMILYCFGISILLSGCNHDEVLEKAEPIPPAKEKLINIDLSVSETNGWYTENRSMTHSHNDNHFTTHQSDERRGIKMDIHIKMGRNDNVIRKSSATTRWSNLDDNIYIRVVAYECTSTAAISTTNYSGHGDYQLLANGTIRNTKALLLSPGIYTFVCYSYGSTSTLPAFANTSISVPVSQGQNFMTCIKSNIAIDTYGYNYLLKDIVFIHRCSRYIITAKAQSGRMPAITACAAKLSLSSSEATYSFKEDELTPNTTSGALNITWNNPNAMSVSSDCVYLTCWRN